MGFEILTEVTVKSMVFWVVRLCTLERAQCVERNISRPASGSKSKLSKTPAEAGGRFTQLAACF
jgi:hypothetical protein